MRGTFVYRNGELVEKSKAEPLHWGFLSRSTEIPLPYINSDYVLGSAGTSVIGQHDGCTYDSKSALRRSYRNAGVVELGSDAPLTAKDNAARITKDEVGAAYRKVREGYKPAPLERGVLPDV